MSVLALDRSVSLAGRHVRLPAAILGPFVSLVAAIAMARPAIDPDLNWHLRTGHLIVSSGAIPTTDPYSFTHHGALWVEHEWLWQVAMAVVDSLSGTLGVIAVNSLLVGFTLALVYGRLRTRAVS